MPGDVLERIREMARGILECEGMNYVHLEMKQSGGGTVLRLLIDREGGVTLDDCSRVSRRLSTQLDIEDPIARAYTLEVSSPGLDRPLYGEDDYRRFAGRRVRVTTVVPRDGRRRFVGRLAGVAGDALRLVLDGGEEIAIPGEQIAEARIVPDLDLPKGRRAGKGRHA
jgi:ribosome maturation factor RimP